MAAPKPRTMRISRIRIQNFRNFKVLDLSLSRNTVVVGENKIGKTNLIHALRLVLDPSLPDSARQLRDEDFWDGLLRPVARDHKITVSIDLTDFEDDENQVAVLGEHLVEPEPMTARLTYVFQCLEDIEGQPTKESDYEFYLYGGDRRENTLRFDIRRRLPLDLLPALRDAEGDIGNWRRSPLRPLLDAVGGRINRDELIALAASINAATDAAAKNEEIQRLVGAINTRVSEMVGSVHAVETALGFSPNDPERLLRALRLYIDSGRREIGAASLGSANVLYLTLKALGLDQSVAEEQRYHTFLAIEEPEAHLHPHLQRLVYRDLLRSSGERSDAAPITVILTTHSPHIVSVAPLDSIVLLRKTHDGRSSEGVSTAELELDAAVVTDLERYLDVTRGEMLFAKGVLLVEGEAERYLVPALAKANGIDFDELGITVCSVAGTNFLPYVELLSERGLCLPVAVITDGDPEDDGRKRGDARIIRLIKDVFARADCVERTNTQLLEMANRSGFFVGDHTCEIDLFRSGAHDEIGQTLADLAPGATSERRALTWKANPDALDNVRFLKDIETIGKGRFAQRLSTRLAAGQWPLYIRSAVTYVRDRCR
ncbi:MAG: AAA family ATPase [Spirochaetaceae bacterium]|nr:AAA family ATPase [Spirochaetaceae bacterium]